MKHQLIFWGMIVSAIIAAAVTTFSTTKQTWMAFIGWTIFYLSIQSPILFSLAKGKAGEQRCSIERFFSRR